MDWRAIDFDWNRVRAFVATAEQGSFSAAARALSSTQPTVGRQVAALEEQLGVTLFERLGPRLQLTRSGLELLEHARHMRDATLQLTLAAAGQSRAVEGEVRITANEALCSYALPPIVVALRGAHPGIRVHLAASHAVHDLRRREADIAVRNLRPSQPDLVGRRVADERIGLYATPDYLRHIHGVTHAADLKRAEVLGFGIDNPTLPHLVAAGLPLRPHHFPTTSNSHNVQWGLCLAGAGIAVMLEAVGDREARVERVLPEVTLSFERWLVCHRELRTSRRLRIVFDHLVEHLT